MNPPPACRLVVTRSTRKLFAYVFWTVCLWYLHGESSLSSEFFLFAFTVGVIVSFWTVIPSAVTTKRVVSRVVNRRADTRNVIVCVYIQNTPPQENSLAKKAANVTENCIFPKENSRPAEY